MRPWLSLAAAALLAVPSYAEGGESGAPPARDSLEQLLARARAQRQAVQDRLAGEVEVLVKELETGPEPQKLGELVERAVALGEEATPLLVRHVDPGTAATDKEKLRALQVAQALSRMDTAAVTTELLEILEKGSNDGKRNALRVLQTNPDLARVRPAIEALFRSSEGSLRHGALSALIALGGPEVDAVIGEVLAGNDENLVAIAIVGLAGDPSDAAAGQIRKILAQTQPAARHARELLKYFQANPRQVRDEDVAAFVRIAQAASVSLDTRVAVVDGLAGLQPALNNELRKSLEPIVGAADRRLRESGLVLLARLGDKNSERDLVREYDDLVAKNEQWSEVYVRRADMYARIGKDDKAVKDYKEALVVGRNDPTLQPDTYEKLARAQVRLGRLKDAAETLNRSTLSLARLHELAEDPEFAPLRNSKWGKEAFALP
jgi:tetratricopeptide (TPR) repeat protein